MRPLLLAAGLIASPLVVLAAPIGVPAGSSILLDNRCPPEEWRDAARRDIGSDVEWLLQHDERFVYLCFKVPAQSFAALDLYLQAEADTAPWNLHASAQLGEKQRGPEGWPMDWSWGNQRDWYSPAVPFRGVTKSGTEAHADFGVVEAREIQISRARFGSGAWHVMVELHALGERGDREARFPSSADVNDATTWQALEFGVD